MTFDANAYRSRLMTADRAVSLIPSGAKIAMGLGVAQPPALLKALADRAAAGSVSALRIYYLLSTSTAGDTVLRRELRDRIRPISLFHGVLERASDMVSVRDQTRLVEVMPTLFSQAPRALCEQVGVDTLLTTVSPMDDEGNFSFGTDTDYALPVSRTARRVILEVNPNMPRVSGDCTVHLSKVTALVEHSAPLIALERKAGRPEDAAIAEIVAGLAENGSCLQMGIGTLPDAVCKALRGHRGLGIHTELMTPGLAELMQAGVVDNSRKQIHAGRSVFTFMMGDAALYRYADGNPLFAAYPVDYVNDPAVIARNDKLLSVNATLQVDLDGACNSECMNGRQYSATGGQLDFVRGAYASRGGRSIIACHSTAADGTVSRIVPRLDGPVTTPRNETHIVVTEHGWADLKGRTSDERASALIGLAHPRFREGLERSARERGLVL